MVVLNNENLRKESLNDLTIILNKQYGIEITKQSLHERFNDKAVAYLKMALEKLLNSQINKENYFYYSTNFNRILIKDSVCFQIDESLVEYYAGSGGSGSKAAVRIQFEYDLLGGTINDLSINAFNDQDATNSTATLEMLKNGDLVIRDLAYMHLSALGQFIENGVSFLCRLNTQTKAYQMTDGKFKELNFRVITKRMKEYNINRTTEDVYIGEKEKLKVRMFIYLLPEKEYNKRIRKAEKNAKKKGRKIGKDFKARACLNLFITDLDDDSISIENCWCLYKLRWQIELMFKVWKSIWEIDEIKKVKKARLECYILSKLLVVVLCWPIVWSTAKALYQNEKKVLSFMKAFKTLRRYASELRFFFEGNRFKLAAFFKKFYEISRVSHLLEKKGSRETSIELLEKSLVLMDVGNQNELKMAA